MSTEGDTVRWTNRWEITGAGSASDVHAAIARQLGEERGSEPLWALLHDDSSAEAAASHWVFADSEGRLWQALWQVVPGSDPSRLELRGDRIGMAIPADLDTSLVQATVDGAFQVVAHPPGTLNSLAPVDRWIFEVRTPEVRVVEGADLAFGGGMVQHGHSFETLPTVAAYMGQGRYAVEGIYLGAMSTADTWWEIRVRIRAGVREDYAVFNIVLPAGQRRGP